FQIAQVVAPVFGAIWSVRCDLLIEGNVGICWRDVQGSITNRVRHQPSLGFTDAEKDGLSGVLALAVWMQMGALLFDLFAYTLTGLDEHSIGVVWNEGGAQPVAVGQLQQMKCLSKRRYPATRPAYPAVVTLPTRPLGLAVIAR